MSSTHSAAEQHAHAALTASNKIDEDLHSRQLAVYGRHAMGKMQTTKVLVSGINGLGAEIAKNVILAQVQSVTLHDTERVTLADLGAHFYLDAHDVGKNRAEACAQRLQELNPSVHVHAVTATLDAALVQAHDVVVLVGHSRAVAEHCSDWCRARAGAPARLTWCGVMGLFGFVCNDFGAEFLVTDTTGENPRTAIVANIQRGVETLVSCVDDERIDFEDGDIVQLHEVEGCDGIENELFKVSSVTKSSFKIGDTTKYAEYKKGGTVVQVKQPKTLNFASLRTVFDATTPAGASLLDTDFSKFGRPQLLLLVLEAIESVRAGGALPVCDAGFAARVRAAAATLNAARQPAQRIDALESQTALIDEIALRAGAVINPMAALFGGIVGQEVVKAASGKFHPIHQWLLFESVESSPKFAASATPINVDAAFIAEHTPADASEQRYAHQIATVGRTVHRALTEQRVFMVGAGALGCEFLKNFAMMGVGTAGPNGAVVLTDDDSIERSNLSRQFLFRNSDVGKSKSAAAAKAAAAMNPALRLSPMQDRVSPLTETTFNDAFWHRLSYVTNALDNVQARLYVDRRCVFFGKALFESGTLGTKCNTQVVIPHVTENYGASRDPQEKMVPDCTLHNFPHTIAHCLSWARSEFVGQFSERPRAAQQFAESVATDAGDDGRQAFLAALRQSGAAGGEIAQTVDGLRKCIGSRPNSFDDCIAWARMLFDEYFVQKVLQLTHLYPQDAITKSGLPFWSPPKRFPNAIVFDDANELHIGFIVAAANLRAVTMGITDGAAYRRNVAYVRSVAAKVVVPTWKPKDNIKIKVDPTEEANNNNNNGADVDDNEVAAALASLPAPSTLRGVKFSPQEFEKDDATNYHMDFIHAVANLRAFNYQVKQVDALQSKLIAGRIIPAIATTTAAATGLVCLEIFKFTRGGAKIEAYRNAFINLALPSFNLIEPMPPAKVVSRTERRKPDPINHPEYVEEEEIVAHPNPHTVWDKLVVDEGDVTIQEFIDYFKKNFGWTCSSIAVPVVVDKGETAAMVYNAFTVATKARLPLSFSSVYEKLTKRPLDDRAYFTPSCLFENDDGASVETPEIIFKFRK